MLVIEYTGVLALDHHNHLIERMPKPIVSLLAVALLSACVSVPPAVTQRTVDASQPEDSTPTCHPQDPDHVATSSYSSQKTPDPLGFRVLIWNVHKGKHGRWLETFAEYSDGQDLVILQEAHLTDELRKLLTNKAFQWDLATTFRMRGHETGLMTLSRAAPDKVCVQRTLEPWLALPKATLISRFPLRGTEETLLVANIHSVNFSMGTAAFVSQLDRLAQVLRLHNGPILIAGDFNTWNGARLKILEQTLGASLLLRKVRFQPGHLKSVFGHSLDHVYYRGLLVVEHEARESATSDHRPMWITFRQRQD
jgi:endonuclease/exonuclease/phosphatase (EEP) superfamily protein YafD